jgi:hypothetical protein
MNEMVIGILREDRGRGELEVVRPRGGAPVSGQEYGCADLRETAAGGLLERAQDRRSGGGVTLGFHGRRPRWDVTDDGRLFSV